MRDLDTKLLEEKYDSIFAGKIEEEEDTSLGAISGKDEDEEKDDKEESSDEEKEEKEDTEDSDSDESDEDESDDDESDDDESDDKSGSSEGGDAGIQSKIKQLQKQYNDLLVDAFEKYAAECIENALDGVESSFGENITDILDGALQELKGKILGDLGVEDDGECPMGMGGMEMEIGGEPEVEFGSEVGGIPTMTTMDDESEESDEEDSDEEEDEVEEKTSCKSKGKKVVKESVKVANYYGFV